MKKCEGKFKKTVALLCCVFMLLGSASADELNGAADAVFDGYGYDLPWEDEAELFADEAVLESSGKVNLAVGKTVTAKSEDGKVIGIVDGDSKNPNKATATSKGAWTFFTKNENWALIDLGALYSVSSIKGYFGYANGGSQKPDTGFSVAYSTNNSVFTDIVKVTDADYSEDYTAVLDSPVIARYIKLTIPSAVAGRAVRVREFEVYGSDEPLLDITRLGTTVTADREDGLAIGLTDGDTVVSDKATETTKGAWTYGGSASAVADLGGAYSVKQINTYFGDKNGADKPKNFSIEVSTDGSTWKPYAEESGDYNYNYSLKHDGINAGYVRLTVNSGETDAFIVREIEVYGVETSYPIASDVVIYGAATVGSVLTADFDYRHTADTACGDSVFNWYSIAEDGARSLVSVGPSYTVAESDVGCKIVCGITPTDVNGACGDEVFSPDTAAIVRGTAVALTKFEVAADGSFAADYAISAYDGNPLKIMLWVYSDITLAGYAETGAAADGSFALTADGGADSYAVAMVADAASGKPICVNIMNTQPSAESFDNTEVAVIYDEATETYSLCGAVDASAVYFTVEDSEDKRNVTSGAAVITDNRLYKRFAFPSGTPSGDYGIKIYFLGNEPGTETAVHFSSVTDKKAAFAKLAAATSAAEFAAVVADNTAVLEISDKYVKDMSISQLEKVCKDMYKNTYIYEESAKFYSDLRSNAALFVIGCGGDSAYDAAQYYKDVLDFSVGTMYAQFEKLSGKAKVFAMFSSTPENAADAVKSFDEFVLLQMINEAESFGKIAEYISTYSAVIPFDLSVYNSSDTTQTSLYLFTNGGSYTSMTSLEQAIIRAKAAQGSGSSSSSGGSSSGGGSSKGGNSVRDTITVGSDVISGGNVTGTQPFADVSRDYWAAEYIAKLKADGTASGDENGNFNPESDITREEFIKMLVISAGVYDASAVCDFADLAKCPWAQSYVASALNSGIINGVGGNTFGAGEKLTRQDMAVMVHRVLGTAAAESLKFTDESEIGGYARAAVAALSSDGIINGFADGSFKPLDTARRSQAAKLICLLEEKLK